ncbi:LysR family transcriptional regulator [Burkholderia sp. Ax-1719]|uniref:LysR family transcriptional regulator n=1 Tax=Burkholderia sp. Ax-1719 TaxID=2608334 RepID=UPI0014240227|nr:LysR family transcriptional regulator [Burkholderia sp. Ax-1719]NIE63186.1 LysR family transcriptional regulator [Burkholderia sp. Ax-1719]
MELRHLRYFLAVAQAANFTKAAESLGIGQPPLSQQIKALETELGADLFRRTAKGAELTAAGKAFEVEVLRILGGAERAVRAAKRAARGETGQLRVGFTATAAFNENVSGLIRRFRESYPDAELTLQEGTSGILLGGLEEDRLDVVIVRPQTRTSESIKQHDWQDEPMLVALPAAHYLASRRQIALAELAKESFIQVPREAGSSLIDNIIEACAAAGFMPILTQPAPQIASAVTLVAAGLGVSIVPKAITQVRVAGVVYRPLMASGLRARLVIASRLEDASAMVQNFLMLA